MLPLRGEHIAVHPDFRIIFTSNPADYAGVHGAQDALLDRMVTILLSGFDQDTEAGITQTHSGLPLAEVERIVALVRAFRDAGVKTGSASVRPAILISSFLRVRGGHAYAENPVFIQTCRDVLLSQARRTVTDPRGRPAKRADPVASDPEDLFCAAAQRILPLSRQPSTGWRLATLWRNWAKIRKFRSCCSRKYGREGLPASYSRGPSPMVDSAVWGTTELAAMLECSGVGIYAADLHGRCVFINRRGLPDDGLLAGGMHRPGHARNRCMGAGRMGRRFPRHECPISAVLLTGSGVLVEDDLFWRRDGTSFPVGYSAQPVLIQGGVAGVTATIWETARRRQAEESLRASEARVRTVFDNALIGMAVVSLEGVSCG